MLCLPSAPVLLWLYHQSAATLLVGPSRVAVGVEHTSVRVAEQLALRSDAQRLRYRIPGFLIEFE
jgi:hypothetical protein